MKNLAFTFAFLIFGIFAKAGVTDSLINLKGYYVIRFDKAEIIDMYAQKVKKLSGSQYQLVIDLESDAFFIPLEIANKRVLKSDSLFAELNNPKLTNKDTVIYLPTAKYIEEYLTFLMGKKADLSNEICLFRDLNSTYPYFCLKGSDKYLFKCIYIEGFANGFDLMNTAKSRAKIGLDVDVVNKKTSVIKVMFLTSVSSYDPFVKNEILIPWYPYITDTLSH